MPTAPGAAFAIALFSSSKLFLFPAKAVSKPNEIYILLAVVIHYSVCPAYRGVFSNATN